MKFSVDEIIDNIIKLEDLETREIRYLKKDDLDFETKENDILILGNNGYYKDEKLKKREICDFSQIFLFILMALAS